MEVLDLFSAAAGGWSLGMHRAGFTTVAACEVEAWRRALYAENNPHVRLYDDVRTLTADRLRDDLGRLPEIVVGSPPCQDISSANTKGKGVEGERSVLYFEAIRIIGEVRPRWFALENSSNLRTRGADAVIAALEAIGYASWPVVVRAGDIGANHERPRCWLIGCDIEPTQGLCVQARRNASDAQRARCEGGFWQPAGTEPIVASSDVGDERSTPAIDAPRSYRVIGAEPTASERKRALDGGEEIGGDVAEPWAEWNFGLAGHLRLDDGLSARLAGTRVAVGDGKGQSAASLVVEAFGDAVIPQIPEAIGRAILRTEAALAAVYESETAAGT